MVARHARPAECYVGSLVTTERASDTARRVERNHKFIIDLKPASLMNVDAADCLKDIDQSAPVKMVHVLLERDKYRPTSLAGRKFLRGCLQHLPDNQWVEDEHLSVGERLAQRAVEGDRQQRGAIACRDRDGDGGHATSLLP